MILYALKSALVLMLLYTCFFVLTSRETFHRLNRVLLVGSLLLALVLPCIQFSVKCEPEAVSTLPMPMVINYEVTQAMDNLRETAQNTPAVRSSLVWVFWLYLAGFSAVVLSTLAQFAILLRYLRGGLRHTDEQGNTVILHRGQVAPFSIFHFIVMSTEDYEARGAILRHEQAHIRLGHTYDLLLLTIVKALQWFSPFVWLLERDLKAVHEYEADESVINLGIDATQYQQLLVTKAVGNRLQPFANNLRRGSLKKRITMMYQKKSRRTTMLKALFVLPATALALCAFTTPEVQQAIEAIDKADPTATVVNKVVAPVAEAISSNEETAQTNAPTPKPNRAVTDDDVPAIASFKCPDIVKALERVQADENTLYMIDDKVLSRQDFMKRAAQMEFKDVSGTGTWSGLGVAAGELGEVAKNYRKAIRIATEDYFKNKAGEVDEKNSDSGATSTEYSFRVRIEGDRTPDENGQWVEQQPIYPGASEGIMRDIAKNLHYPTYAMENDIKGIVVVEVEVKTDGNIGAIKVLRSLEERCDAEAVLAVSKLKKFTAPAKRQGTPVRSYLTIPVRFSLK